MAQFTTQGRLKLLFNGEGVSSILEQKDPFLYKCRSVQTNKRRTRCMGSSARIYYASTSSLCNKSNRCNAGASSSAGNGSVHDEYDEDEDEDDGYDEDDDVFDRDGLSCFRGLVLDIAYRFFFFLAKFLHFFYCCYACTAKIFVLFTFYRNWEKFIWGFTHQGGLMLL